MKIYISGQITGLSEKEFKQNFKAAKVHIYTNPSLVMDDGFLLACQIINPIDLEPFLGIEKWLFYMITDLYALSKCTHIAMQKNWINSRGATIEYYFAKFVFKLKVIWL